MIVINWFCVFAFFPWNWDRGDGYLAEAKHLSSQARERLLGLGRRARRLARDRRFVERLEPVWHRSGAGIIRMQG